MVSSDVCSLFPSVPTPEPLEYVGDPSLNNLSTRDIIIKNESITNLCTEFYNYTEKDEKMSAKKYEDHRIIILKSHLLKLFFKIIHKGIYETCEDQLASNQLGFLNPVGSTEALISVLF